MFRDILSNRLFLTSIVFFVVIVSCSLIYSWRVHKSSEEAVELTRQQVQRLEEPTAPDPEVASVDSSPVVSEPAEMPPREAGAMSPAAATVAHLMDLVESVSADDPVPLAESAEEVGVSPFGFGPYPELPEGWPADEIWPCSSPDHELMARVFVKLAHQGITTIGGTMGNGLVYPTYPGAVYITWAYREDGVLYIESLSGDDEPFDRIRAIEEARGDDFSKSDIPSDIKVLSYEEDGIDPYTFLNLQ